MHDGPCMHHADAMPMLTLEHAQRHIPTSPHCSLPFISTKYSVLDSSACSVGRRRISRRQVRIHWLQTPPPPQSLYPPPHRRRAHHWRPMVKGGAEAEAEAEAEAARQAHPANRCIERDPNRRLRRQRGGTSTTTSSRITIGSITRPTSSSPAFPNTTTTGPETATTSSISSPWYPSAS